MLVGENWEITLWSWDVGQGIYKCPSTLLRKWIKSLARDQTAENERITHLFLKNHFWRQSVCYDRGGWMAVPSIEIWDWNPHSLWHFPLRLELCNSRAVSTDGIWVTDFASHPQFTRGFCSQQSGVCREAVVWTFANENAFFHRHIPQKGGWFIDKPPELYLTLDVAKNTIHTWLMLETPVL